MVGKRVLKSPRISSLSGSDYRYLGHFGQRKFLELGHNYTPWEGRKSTPPRHNEVSRTIEMGKKFYNISSGDNDRQMSMTEEEALRVAGERGLGKEYNTVGEAVSAAISESKEAGKLENMAEMWTEHRGKRR